MYTALVAWLISAQLWRNYWYVRARRLRQIWEFRRNLIGGQGRPRKPQGWWVSGGYNFIGRRAVGRGAVAKTKGYCFRSDFLPLFGYGNEKGKEGFIFLRVGMTEAVDPLTSGRTKPNAPTI